MKIARLHVVLQLRAHPFGRCLQIFVPKAWGICFGRDLWRPHYTAGFHISRGYRADAPEGEIPWRFDLSLAWNWLPDILLRKSRLRLFGRAFCIVYPIGLTGIRPRWRRSFHLVRAS